MNRDPLGETGGINLYGFVGGNPVNWIDPWGLRVHYEGTAEEKALMQQWLDKLKECAKCDEELAERLDEVLSGPYNYYVHFKPGWTAGGTTPPRIRLDPTLKNPNYTGEEYQASPSQGDRRTSGHYRGPDVLAHELLGHGYDWSQDDFNDNQRKAIDLANKIRACLGNKQPQRKK